jgi:hypothetical protein
LIGPSWTDRTTAAAAEAKPPRFRPAATSDLSSGKNSFSDASLSNARAVLAFSSALADQVRDGSTTLNEAFDKVQKERRSKESDEKRVAALPA